MAQFHHCFQGIAGLQIYHVVSTGARPFPYLQNIVEIDREIFKIGKTR
jgi:hypothetical protein